MRHDRGHALVFDIMIGLSIILCVVLLVASLFPSSYKATVQAARMTEAVNLARRVLERQKQILPANAIGNQTVDAEFKVQGKSVICQFFYRLDADSAVTADPRLWKVTVQWYNNNDVREVLLVGASPSQ